MRFLIVLLVLSATAPASAQRLTSYSAGAGVTTDRTIHPTAAFSLSAGFDWGWSWLAVFQRSVADLKPEPGGTKRTSALTLGPSARFGKYIMIGAGASLFSIDEAWSDSTRERNTAVWGTALAALQLPIAGEGVSLELLGRSDYNFRDAEFPLTVTLGVRVRPDAPKTLTRGEPTPQRMTAERAAVWNDVIMQLILLEQSLESFERIREIETGIELEFDQREVTLYDDVARVARVLAAADPPVFITVFAPNAGRTAAAATAGSFPPERIRLQRENRVYLRVEH
jgi:hypothetical protein